MRLNNKRCQKPVFAVRHLLSSWDRGVDRGANVMEVVFMRVNPTHVPAHIPFSNQHGKKDIDLFPEAPGIRPVCRSCALRKGLPVQSPGATRIYPPDRGFFWVLHGHGRIRRFVGWSVGVVRAGPLDPRSLALPSGCWRYLRA
jgi:hypothetical protein